MKNFLNQAMGGIDSRYIDESANEFAVRKTRIAWKKIPALAAAVFCVALLTVAAAAFGMRYFVPGVGILNDGSLEVYISEGSIQLGEGFIDAVMVTDYGDTKTASMWIYRPESMGLEGTVDGKVPAELDFVYVVGEDGTLIEHKNSSMATAGFSTYNYQNVPSTESITIRDYSGNEATVSLVPLNKSKYAGVEGIRFGEKTVAAIPVAESENLIAAEFYDPLTAKLAKSARTVSAYMIADTVTSDGAYGKVSGNVMLKGIPQDTTRTRVMDVGIYNYNRGIEKFMPKFIDVSMSFEGPDMPEVSYICPAPGETLALDLVVYECEEFTLRVTGVTYGEKGLTYTYDSESRVEDPTFQINDFYVDHYIYSAVDYINGQTHIQNDHARIEITNYSKGKWGAFVTDFDDPALPVVPLEAGTEIFLTLRSLRYTYLPENFDYEDPNSHFGIIEFQ